MFMNNKKFKYLNMVNEELNWYSKREFINLFHWCTVYDGPKRDIILTKNGNVIDHSIQRV